MSQPATAPAPAPTPPPPATPLELTFRPGRRDAIQGFVAAVPNWFAYLGGFFFLAQLSNLMRVVGSSPGGSLAAGSGACILLAWLATELAFRLASPDVRLTLDSKGLRVVEGTASSIHAWAKLSVRETASAYVFFTGWPLGVALPRRALSVPQRAIVEAWLAEHKVKTRRKPMPSLRGLLLTFVGIVLFVTCYNLMQSPR